MLGGWGGPGATDVAELLTSELVTNALVHTDHGAVVTATVDTEQLRVEVRDFVPGLTRPRVPHADDARTVLVAQHRHVVGERQVHVVVADRDDLL
ncbi:hypothetical protein ACWEV0_16125, partial [Streptomyces sp. NPDC003943]